MTVTVSDDALAGIQQYLDRGRASKLVLPATAAEWVQLQVDNAVTGYEKAYRDGIAAQVVAQFFALGADDRAAVQALMSTKRSAPA